MKYKCSNKINSLVCFSLFFFLSGFSLQCYAGNLQTKNNDSEKHLIRVIPLNITADDKNEKAIRGSVEKFLLQRLNNKKNSAEITEKLIGLTADELNKIYTSLNSNIIDVRIKQGEGNDYLCGGNVVALGTSVVSDFFLYSIESGTKVVEHSSSGNDIGTVLTSADVFTGKVKSMLSQKSADVSAVGSTIAKTDTDKSGSEKKILIKSDKVEGEITSVVFSKFDETGKSYAVFSLAEKIVVMEIRDNKFVFKSEFKNNENDKIIGMASIDTDQDGVEELVVSNLKSDNRTINSYVVKWENGKFVKKLSNMKWIFSSSDSVGSNDHLYAQKNMTLKSTLDSGILKIGFEKGQVVVPEKPLDIPKWVLLPGLALNPIADFIAGVAFRSDNRLGAFSKNGEMFWESSKAFGGSNTYFLEQHSYEKDLDNRIWLNSQVSIAEIYNDNKYKEIIVVENVDGTRKLFARFRNLNEGRLTIFSVSDLTCTVAAQSEKVSGYISGFDLKSEEKKKDHLALYSVVQKGENIFSKKKSFIVVQNVNSFKRVYAD